MKIVKIVFGILSILVGLVLFLEAWDVIRLASAAKVDGFHIYAGIIVAFIYIGIGIFSLVTLNSAHKSFESITIILSLVAFQLSFMGPELFGDLRFLSSWAIISLITCIITLIIKGKPQNKDMINAVSQSTNKEKCPYCHADIDANSMYCGACGKKIGKTCPHCGASMNEGDVFCTECGKKIDDVQAESAEEELPTKESPNDKSENDALVEDSKETSQKEEKEEEPQYNYEYEEEPKNYKPYIIGVIAVLLLLGCGWWYYDSSNQRVAREKAIADSLELVRQDSIHKADSLKNEELQAAEKEKHIEACKAFLNKFYKGLEGSQNVEEYVSNYITDNARKTLIEEYDYDCESNDCLAFWLFSYEAGSDTGPLRERTIEVEDENTYQVINTYELDYDGYTAYEYIVRLSIVKEGNFYKIDKIEKVSSGPIIG